MSLFDVLSTPVATVLKAIHTGLSTFLAPSSGPAWGLSIVLLTICVRLVLFPLFVKQIKSQRRMQELAPRIKELQARHKGDRETMNTELMKLYKENNANPVAGCLPLVLQLPVFFALFRTIREFKPDGAGAFHPKFGLSAELLKQGSHAKVFGAPISAAFNSSSELLQSLNGHATNVKIVAAVMIITMGASTFYTQRQMMARNAPGDAQQAQVQKFLLYVLPLSFAFFGFSFPIGVLLYWLTTNLWSMGQQAYVIKRMPPVVPGAAGTTPGRPSSGGPGAGPVRPSSRSGGPGNGPVTAVASPRGSRLLGTRTSAAASPSSAPSARGQESPPESSATGPARNGTVITAAPSRGVGPGAAGAVPDMLSDGASSAGDADGAGAAGLGSATSGSVTSGSVTSGGAPGGGAPGSGSPSSGRAAGSRKNKTVRRGGRR